MTILASSLTRESNIKGETRRRFQAQVVLISWAMMGPSGSRRLTFEIGEQVLDALHLAAPPRSPARHSCALPHSVHEGVITRRLPRIYSLFPVTKMVASASVLLTRRGQG